MTIDRVVLHGTPGDAEGSVRMHEVPPYEGSPKPTVDLKMAQFDGFAKKEVVITFFYTGTGPDGIPHYRRRKV